MTNDGEILTQHQLYFISLGSKIGDGKAVNYNVKSGPGV